MAERNERERERERNGGEERARERKPDLSSGLVFAGQAGSGRSTGRHETRPTDHLAPVDSHQIAAVCHTALRSPRVSKLPRAARRRTLSACATTCAEGQGAEGGRKREACGGGGEREDAGAVGARSTGRLDACNHRFASVPSSPNRRSRRPRTRRPRAHRGHGAPGSQRPGAERGERPRRRGARNAEPREPAHGERNLEAETKQSL